MKIWKLLVNAFQDLVPYNPSISTLRGPKLLWDEFIDLLTAAKESQIKAW